MIEALKVELATNKTRVENCTAEIQKIKQRKAQLNNDIKGLVDRVKEFENKKKELQRDKDEKLKEEKIIEQTLTKFRKKNNLDNVE